MIIPFPGSVQSTRRFHKVSYQNFIRSDCIKPVPYYYDLTRPGYVDGCSGLQLRTVTENILWFQEEVVVSRQNEFAQSGSLEGPKSSHRRKMSYHVKKSHSEQRNFTRTVAHLKQWKRNLILKR